MKIYIDFLKQAITKTEADTIYQGDVGSNEFNLFFFNYGNNTSNWYPTMSQLAPNGRAAGDYAADALGSGETHNYTEDGVTYQKYTFTMGDTWVKSKGKNQFYIWLNTNTPMTRKCIGQVNVTINESTNNYFIDDITVNPNVRGFINVLFDNQNETIAELSQGTPSVFDTTAHIQAFNTNKGVAVATDTGYIWYWDTTLTTPTYVNSNLIYNGLYYKSLTASDVTVRNDTLNNGYVTNKDYTLFEATLTNSLLTAITTSDYSFGCNMALLASGLGFSMPINDKVFFTKVSESTGSFLFDDISSQSFNAKVIKFTSTDYEQTINLTFIHPTQSIGLVTYDSDHYFVMFEKSNSTSVVEINMDDLVFVGEGFVEVWLKLTDVKVKGSVKITPQMYLASDESQTNLFNIPDTVGEGYSNGDTIITALNGTLDIGSIASILGLASLTDTYVMVDRYRFTDFDINAQYTLKTAIKTTGTSQVQGKIEVIYKYMRNLASSYTAKFQYDSPLGVDTADTHNINIQTEAENANVVVINSEVSQQISKKNVILKAGADVAEAIISGFTGDNQIYFYPQKKIENVSMITGTTDLYIYKNRIFTYFDYGRDCYLTLAKMVVDGREYYRFEVDYTPIIFTVHYTSGTFYTYDGDLNTPIFECDNTPTLGSTNPIQSDAVYYALQDKQDTLTFDNTPTQNSTNPVTSGGVYNSINALNIAIAGTGHSIAIDSNDYKITAILKDANGNTISTSNTIDLHLESVVVSGAYDDATKKVILTLQNGSTIEFSVADLVSGLQTEITAQNKLSSDLIDDTNHTNKFVTASEKAQITTNANNISNLRTGSDLTNTLDFTKTVNQSWDYIIQNGLSSTPLISQADFNKLNQNTVIIYNVISSVDNVQFTFYLRCESAIVDQSDMTFNYKGTYGLETGDGMFTMEFSADNSLHCDMHLTYTQTYTREDVDTAINNSFLTDAQMTTLLSEVFD